MSVYIIINPLLHIIRNVPSKHTVSTR